MPDPLSVLPPADPATPPAVIPRPTAEDHLRCEFCGCTLTPHGHALELSDKARRYRDHNDDVAKLNAQIESLTEQNRALTRELADLKAKANRGFFG